MPKDADPNDILFGDTIYRDPKDYIDPNQCAEPFYKDGTTWFCTHDKGHTDPHSWDKLGAWRSG